MPRHDFRDRRVIVTGASSGIGRALALELAERGAKVLLSARREELLHKLAEECRAAGGTAAVEAGDVTDNAYRQLLLNQARQLYGGLDVLVNNAGISAHGEFVESDEAILRQIMEVNFFAATELTRAALPLLAHGVRPAIVNIGSILGHRGLPFNSEYCASKFALRGWTESLRTEVAAKGIHVLLVSPGTTDTEFFEHLVAQRTKLPWREPKAISPTAVARQTVRALHRRRRDIFPNWRGRGMVLANRLAPWLIDRALARLARRSHGEASDAQRQSPCNDHQL